MWADEHGLLSFIAQWKDMMRSPEPLAVDLTITVQTSKDDKTENQADTALKILDVSRQHFGRFKKLVRTGNN